MGKGDAINGKYGKILYGAGIAITGAAHAAGVVTITAVGHGLSVGQYHDISGVVGMTDINDKFRIISVPTDDTFTISKTTSQTYTSGGTIKKTVPIVDWSWSESSPTKDGTDNMSGDWAEKVQDGWKEGSGSFAIHVRAGVPFPTADDGELLLRLNVNDDIYREGNAFITNQSEAVTVRGGDTVRIPTDFESTGEWTRSDGTA